MADDTDKTRRDSLAVTPEKTKAPPRDRDQAPYSPAVAADKADDAEFPETPGTRDTPEKDESLIARDNMKGAPPRSR